MLQLARPLGTRSQPGVGFNNYNDAIQPRSLLRPFNCRLGHARQAQRIHGRTQHSHQHVGISTSGVRSLCRDSQSTSESLAAHHMSHPKPPIPPGLLRLLHDYPEHIERIQQALDEAFNTPSPAIDPFEQALWRLEARLETFFFEAQAELRAAECEGDPGEISAAKEKVSLMVLACSGSAGGGLVNMEALRHFLREHGAATQ